jgi:hypothetical protein
LRSGTFELFGLKFLHTLHETLEWDTFSQITLWQLLTAECMRHTQHVAALITALLAHVDPLVHIEACMQLLYICNGTLPDDHLLFSIPWEQFEDPKATTSEERELKERRRWLLVDMLTGWIQWRHTIATLMGDYMLRDTGNQQRCIGLLRALATLEGKESVASLDAFKHGFNHVLPTIKSKGRITEFACFIKHLDQPSKTTPVVEPERRTRKRTTTEVPKNNGKPRTTINSSKKRRILHSDSEHVSLSSDSE